MVGFRTYSGKVGIVIGGSIDVWDEYEKTIALLKEAQLDYLTFVTNDSIPAFNDFIDVACTLHPTKLPMWAKARNDRGLNIPRYVFSFRADLCPLVTNVLPDWGGSSGLFAVRVAYEGFHCKRIICCGVPLSINRGHIRRGPKYHWPALQFQKGWNDHYGEYAHCTRSWSGWTSERLGVPTLEFLQ